MIPSCYLLVRDLFAAAQHQDHLLFCDGALVYVVGIFIPHHFLVSAFWLRGRYVRTYVVFSGGAMCKPFLVLYAAINAWHRGTSSARYSRSDSGPYPLRRICHAVFKIVQTFPARSKLVTDHSVNDV